MSVFATGLRERSCCKVSVSVFAQNKINVCHLIRDMQTINHWKDIKSNVTLQSGISDGI